MGIPARSLSLWHVRMSGIAHFRLRVLPLPYGESGAFLFQIFSFSVSSLSINPFDLLANLVKINGMEKKTHIFGMTFP